jgi:chemotaxis protein MotB
MKRIQEIYNYKNLVWLLLLSAVSCVPARQFTEIKTKLQACNEDGMRLSSENQKLSTSLTEVSAANKDLEKRVNALVVDTSSGGTSLRRITSIYNELSKAYEKLIANNEKLLSGNTEETKKLIVQLQETQTRLQKKEDELKAIELKLNEKESKLNAVNETLKQRESKLEELQSILHRKDSTVNALKNNVSDALLGFKDKGLTVETRNGKVYVSLEERLLFASGSTVVDPKGVEALRQLAKVLDKNPDINVMVEGHTDNVPISGAIKDNWDLSVMRATSVIRILTSSANIDARRLTAAGRGPFLPIDPANTAEARKKNRRTEIILSPKLDELLKVLENN